MLTQSFLYKLSDLAKSSRFLFFITILSFGLVHTSENSKKPAPIKSSSQITNKKRNELEKIIEQILVASMNQGKELRNGYSKPVHIMPSSGVQMCPPWPD